MSKRPGYSLKAYRIARRDECQIVTATLAVKILILVFGIHVFNALEPAAPPKGIGLEVWNSLGFSRLSKRCPTRVYSQPP